MASHAASDALSDDDWVPPGAAEQRQPAEAPLNADQGDVGSEDGVGDADDAGDDDPDNDTEDDLADDLWLRDESSARSGQSYQPTKHVLSALESRIRLDMLGHDSMPNHVAGVLKKHHVREEERRDKVKDKSDRATNEQVLDDRTRLVIFKLMKGCFFSAINGCISTGKEANVYFCDNTYLPPDPAAKSAHSQLALKVFKTSILVFKDRDRYVTGEFRFRRGYAKSNPRKMVKLWAEKEFRNLLRLRKGGIRAPEPVVVRSHLLLMEFLGYEGWPSPRLKDATIKPKRLAKCYRALVLDVRRMYHACHLVHADLSEYNILYHNKQLYIIDVSQSVEHDHPHAMEFLRSDCANVTRFFADRGVVALRVRELFEFVTALELPGGDEALHLDALLSEAATRPPMTQQELSDQHVFEQIFIPRTLNEVALPDLDADVDKSGGAKTSEYLGATSVATTEAVVDAEEERAVSDSENDDHDHIASLQFSPASPIDAARTDALFCVAHMPLPPMARRLVAQYVWLSRDEPEWVKLVKRLQRRDPDAIKAERRRNKLAVKAEQREKRKDKIPKKVKKRAIKVSSSKRK